MAGIGPHSRGNVFQAQSIVGLTTLFEEVLERMESGEPVDADRAALLLERMLLECSFIIEEKVGILRLIICVRFGKT